MWKELSNDIEQTLQKVSPAILEIVGGRVPATATVIGKGRALSVAHAMGPKDQGHVLLHDENTAQAKIIGRDAATDLVLLDIDADIEPLTEHPAPGLGALVVAVGRRRGALSATSGIVAERGDGFMLRSGAAFFAYIDVDSGLPRGLSGGPLLGAGGTWLGINTHGLTRGGTTIDAKTARVVADALEKAGRVVRGRIGVAVRAARVDGTAQKHGLLVTELVKGAPAQGADVRVGDVILSAHGTETQQAAHLMLALTGVAEQSVSLSLLRQGERLEVSVPVEERPEKRRRSKRRRR